MISLTLMAMGVVYIQSVAMLGLSVSALGLAASLGYLYLGQVMLGREKAPCLARSLLLAIVFPERPDPRQYARHFRSLLRRRRWCSRERCARANAMSAAGAAGRN